MFNRAWLTPDYTFKLVLHNEYDKTRKQWAKMLQVVPQDLDKETDKLFLKRLGPFREPFNIPREQLATAHAQLTSRMDPEGLYAEPE